MILKSLLHDMWLNATKGHQIGDVYSKFRSQNFFVVMVTKTLAGQLLNLIFTHELIGRLAFPCLHTMNISPSIMFFSISVLILISLPESSIFLLAITSTSSVSLTSLFLFP